MISYKINTKWINTCKYIKM